VPRLCEFCPGICLTTEEKAWKNLSQRKKNLSQNTLHILPKHPHITKPTHTHTSQNLHTRARAPTHYKTHTHSHTHIHTLQNLHTHTLTHTHTPTHYKTYTHTHTHTHYKTYTHTHTHTHTLQNNIKSCLKDCGDDRIVGGLVGYWLLSA
jgi:hypothetical protein